MSDERITDSEHAALDRAQLDSYRKAQRRAALRFVLLTALVTLMLTLAAMAGWHFGGRP